MTTSFKARFGRGVLIPEQPLDLREGEVIELEMKKASDGETPKRANP